MNAPRYSYDEKCFELAKHFYPQQSFAFLEALAQAFQDVAEGREDDDTEGKSPSRGTIT